MRYFLKLYLIVFFLVVQVAGLHADVRINEFMASAWDRQVTWDATTGQPRIGGQGPIWYEEVFDASEWFSGSAPFGFGVGSVATDLAQDVLNKTPSLYLRKSFTLSAAQAASSSELQLQIDYDD